MPIRIINMDGSGGGGTGAAFTVIQTDTGTNPVATGPNDTLTLTGTQIKTAGNSATDTVTYSIAAGAITNTEVNNSAAIARSKLAALTASRAMVTDGSGFDSAATTTSTEIGYVNGVTSAIQTQLNAKSPSASPTFTGTVTLPSGTVTSSAWDTGTSTFTSNSVAFTSKAPLASPAFTTQVTFGNYHMEPSYVDEGNSGTSDTLDWGTSNTKKSTLTGNCTYTFSNPQTGGPYLLYVYTGSGSFVPVWPGTVKWTDAAGAPTLTAASKMFMINFAWDGTNYWGSYLGPFTP